MPFLRNTWYVAAWVDDLKPGELLPRRILDESIVFFRQDDGAVAAIGNVCPHRFSPLHLGKLLSGGRIQCPYHGLQYDATGACVFNPHGNGRIPPGAKVKSYAARIKHGIVWVWMGEEVPTETTIPDYSILDNADPANMAKKDWIRMNANYLLITENLLDLSHASFLHEGILGNEETIAAKISIEQIGETLFVDRESPNSRIIQMLDLMYLRDGRKVDTWTKMRWDKPACLLNEAGVTEPGAPREEGTGIFGIHLLTPETETTTLYHFVAVRWNPIPFPEDQAAEIRKQLSDLRRQAFEDQDQIIIDAQQLHYSDPHIDTSRPALLDVDAGPVRFRRILDRLIAEEDRRADEPRREQATAVTR